MKSFVRKSMAVGVGVAILFATAGSAQMVQQIDPRNVPAGSPVGSVDPRTLPNQGGLSTADPLGAAILRPDSVVDTERQLLLTEQLLSAQRQTTADSIVRPIAKPSEFERYVERVLGRKLPRFGSNLLLPAQRDFATPATATVPPDYILNVGDVVSIAMAARSRDHRRICRRR